MKRWLLAYGLTTVIFAAIDVVWIRRWLAVLKDFPVVVAVTDIAWGVGVCALVTWLAVAALRKIPVGGSAS